MVCWAALICEATMSCSVLDQPFGMPPQAQNHPCYISCRFSPFERPSIVHGHLQMRWPDPSWVELPYTVGARQPNDVEDIEGLGAIFDDCASEEIHKDTERTSGGITVL